MKSENIPAKHKWMTTDELAKRLRIHPSTAQKWRTLGIGPTAYQAAPRSYRYDSDEVDEFVKRCAAADIKLNGGTGRE